MAELDPSVNLPGQRLVLVSHHSSPTAPGSQAWLCSLTLLSFSVVAQPNCLRHVSSGCWISQEVFAAPEPHFLQGL